ncbi:MAG: GWxTD domain-containing protein, partial [Candidatus Aminicenantes bacterium]|nr:GWxTD domain-containing protein [Candidatus Aminicenantes bacterium]
MKKNLLLLSVLIGLLFPCPTSVEADEKAKLPPIHKAWLEEEVVYIISPVEREVFLQLNSDRERDMFILAFWKQRDPTPGTPENEFRKEHSDRISHANRRFGRGTPKPGWKTDRGRMYIILGEPNDIQRFEGKTQVYPTEVWFYQGKSDVGLPAGFSLVFFQESAVGEYRLYSPLADGPQALLTSYYGDPMDYYSAYTTLREFEADLAEVSLSLIPGEGSTIGGRPSMISDMLIQRVEGTPQKQIQTRYARKFLEYKDIVEV